MRKIITLLFLLSVTFSFAQIPPGYYATATGSGYALKTQLKNIITTGHIDQGYAALWTLYTQSAFRDNYYENNGSLLDMYSERPFGPDSYEYTSTSQQCGSYSGEGQCYNREHLVPQSYFDGFAVDPMKNDPFHVVPSDGSVNGARGNYPFGTVSSPTYTSSNLSKRGNNVINSFSSYSGIVFEPIDEFKGDIARAFFYFATRYENNMTNFFNSANATTCQSKNMFDGTTNKVFSDAFILLLIKWHKQDPVSAKEIAQNNAIYAFQGNRNPFIDTPAYVCNIWTSFCNTVDTLPSESFVSLDNDIVIYPNPTTNGSFSISSTVTLKNITIYNVNGQIVQEIKNPSTFNTETYNVNNLSTGFYLVQLASDNGTTTKKIIVN
jgi:endonuclease I